MKNLQCIFHMQLIFHYRVNQKNIAEERKKETEMKEMP